MTDYMRSQNNNTNIKSCCFYLKKERKKRKKNYYLKLSHLKHLLNAVQTFDVLRPDMFEIKC